MFFFILYRTVTRVVLKLSKYIRTSSREKYRTVTRVVLKLVGIAAAKRAYADRTVTRVVLKRHNLTFIILF